MDRQALEALSASELQRLIADAAAVLASRAGAASAGRPASAAVPAAAPSAAPSASGTGSLFTFGAASSSTAAVGESLSGISNPFAVTNQSKSIFGTTSSVGASKLFGGTGGGLFSDLGSEPSAGGAKASAFAPASRAAGSEAADASAADGEQRGCEGGEGAGGDDDRFDDRFVPHEEVTLIQGWTPSITLEVCGSIETGEEQEEQIYSQRSKLYRFRDGEWKERGLGEARLLKDKSSGRIRFLLRQEKTGKVAANFFVLDRRPYCDLRPNADSEKIWVWCAQDFSDGEAHVEELALKFHSVDLAAKFKEAFEDAKAENSKLMAEELKASESKEDSGKEAPEASK